MSKNRTELISAVNAQIVPTVTTAIHRALLNNELIDSMVTRKDVILSETATTGNVTVNFSNKDLATISAPDNLTVGFTNIENGDVKYVAITKIAGKTISFASTNDISVRKSFIIASAGLIIYRIECKNNIINACSINIDNDINTTLLSLPTTPTAATLLNGWVAPPSTLQKLVYFKDSFGNLRVIGTIFEGTATHPASQIMFQLPVGYRPVKSVFQKVVSFLGYSDYLIVRPNGDVELETETSVYYDYAIDIFIPAQLLA